MPDAAALDVIRRGADRIVEVSDDEIAEALRIIYSATHNCAEGAGAAALAALVKERERRRGGSAAVILSGHNIDRAWMQAVLAGGRRRFEPRGSTYVSCICYPISWLRVTFTLIAQPALNAANSDEATHSNRQLPAVFGVSLKSNLPESAPRLVRATGSSHEPLRSAGATSRLDWVHQQFVYGHFRLRPSHLSGDIRDPSREQFTEASSDTSFGGGSDENAGRRAQVLLIEDDCAIRGAASLITLTTS